jgi:hypothetical protein
MGRITYPARLTALIPVFAFWLVSCNTEPADPNENWVAGEVYPGLNVLYFMQSTVKYALGLPSRSIPNSP